jgi:hypothetical protein
MARADVVGRLLKWYVTLGQRKLPALANAPSCKLWDIPQVAPMIQSLVQVPLGLDDVLVKGFSPRDMFSGTGTVDTVEEFKPSDTHA